MGSPKAKIVISSLVALCIIAALVYVLVNTTSKTPVDDTTKPDHQTQPKVTRTDVDPTVVPEKVPKDIPMEKGATIIQNYTLATTDGKAQSTRAFKTSKSLADNYKLYTNYFNDNGWTIQNFVDNPKSKMINAVKDETRVQVTLNESSVDKSRTVDITVTDVVH